MPSFTFLARGGIFLVETSITGGHHLVKGHGKFNALLKQRCSKIRNTGTLFHAMDEHHIQISMQVRAHYGSKRFEKLVKKMDRLENDLKNAFPEKEVCVHIWVHSKRSPQKRIYKPFKNRHITFIMTAIRNR
jgi:hypothetical protein